MRAREELPASAASAGGEANSLARRWVCRCSSPPVLLATVEDGQVNLKIRDRYYHIEGLRGQVRATCPRCGKQHVLALGGATDAGGGAEPGPPVGNAAPQ